MKIRVEDLKFQTIIGILGFEREMPQDVIVDLEIEYAYTDEFINYTDVTNIIKTTIKESKFLLIEDAIEALSLKLKKEFSKINTLNLRISKPSILPDCKVSVSNTYKFNS